jgi:hypothetical protein
MASGVIYGSPADDTDKKGNIAAYGAALTVCHKNNSPNGAAGRVPAAPFYLKPTQLLIANS